MDARLRAGSIIAYCIGTPASTAQATLILKRLNRAASPPGFGLNPDDSVGLIRYTLKNTVRPGADRHLRRMGRAIRRGTPKRSLNEVDQS